MTGYENRSQQGKLRPDGLQAPAHGRALVQHTHHHDHREQGEGHIPLLHHEGDLAQRQHGRRRYGKVRTRARKRYCCQVKEHRMAAQRPGQRPGQNGHDNQRD
ncbi:MAG: hypothetical protein ACLUE1_02400 [Adlercreutzia equolifaciens]